MLSGKCLFYLCFIVVLVHTKDTKSKLVVKIKNGSIRGREAKTVGLNLTYYAYQGIPYGQPPIGKLRFEPPVPKNDWQGVLDATKDGNICVQGGDDPAGSEDCLFVNVYVPEVNKHKGKLIPTMVWIFGGGFAGGSPVYDLYGPDYLLEKDVIVVTVNYRLGIFGFLSTGDMVVPGNNGLKDQVLALKWVRDNIAYFGGDPAQVTLFGQSAGSASVSYHMQSRQSQGLFQRAILESGVSLNLWAFSRRVPEVTKKVAEDLSLDTSSSQKIVDGLRSVSYSTLQTISAKSTTWQYLTHDPRHGFSLGPVAEPEHNDAFFTKKSHQVLTEGIFNKVPCIIGYNSLEGTFSFTTLFKIYLASYDLDNTKLIPIDMNVDSKSKDSVAAYIKDYYFGKNLIIFSDRKLMQFLSDDLFVRPIREYVRRIYKYAPVYFYEFAYEGGLWGFGPDRPQPGVAHSEELGYLWRSPYEPSKQDIITRKRMTTMWTDFAKTGNPTPEKYFTTSGTIWKRTDANFTYLYISDDLTLKQFPEESNMDLWDQLYQVYGNPPHDTY